jgi:hypothetical protein
MGTKIALFFTFFYVLISACKKEDCTNKIEVNVYFPDTNWFCYSQNYSSYIIESSDSLKQTLYSVSPKHKFAGGVYNFNVKPGDECKDFQMQVRRITTIASIYNFRVSYGLDFNSTNDLFNLYCSYSVAENNDWLSESFTINLNTDTLSRIVESNKLNAPQVLKYNYYPIYTNRFGVKFPEVFEFKILGADSTNIPTCANKLFFAKKYGLIEYHQKNGIKWCIKQ